MQAIEAPHDWDELRRDVYGQLLRPLVRYLVDDVQHEAVVSALLYYKRQNPFKWSYADVWVVR